MEILKNNMSVLFCVVLCLFVFVCSGQRRIINQLQSERDRLLVERTELGRMVAERFMGLVIEKVEKLEKASEESDLDKYIDNGYKPGSDL